MSSWTNGGCEDSWKRRRTDACCAVSSYKSPSSLSIVREVYDVFVGTEEVDALRKAVSGLGAFRKTKQSTNGGLVLSACETVDELGPGEEMGTRGGA
jgi:hypothetical protein